MNKVILCGRNTKAPEVRYTDSGMCIARFTLAVDRRFKRDGEPTADFINCVVFGKTAEFVERYIFDKGVKLIIEGRIQVRNYQNNEGNMVYITEVVGEQLEFAESKRTNEANNGSASRLVTKPDADGFMMMPDGMDDELPFM